MAIKKTIYLTDRSEAVIGASEIYSLSSRINQILNRYATAYSQALPTLTQGEWLAIADAMNGTYIDEHWDASPARGVAMNIEDSVPDGLNEKWGIDALALSQKIRALPYISQVAILEWVIRFWALSDKDYATDAERIAAAGTP